MSARKPPKRRPPHLVLDFWRGLSVLGLARKYGRTVEQVEAAIRPWVRR